MKRFSLLLFQFCLLAVSYLLVSCGASKGHFKLEGKFLHLNQGEFYVYSPDGVIEGMDTIKVEGGRFAYEIPCEDEGTLVLVFPNFSKQPVFAGSGKSVEIKADASHLKEMEVSGSKDNELMTKFRHQIATASPPDIRKYAKTFIADHPESLVSVYLLDTYFINTPQPAYKEAAQIIQLLLDHQPKNGYLVRMKKSVDALSATTVGQILPVFTTYNLGGTLVSSATLKAAPVALIYTWASWNYDSQELQRQLHRLREKSGGRLQLLGFCIDADKNECRNVLQRDTIGWNIVCNGQMFSDKSLQALGITYIPDNIVLQNGRIVARSLRSQELKERLEQLLR